MNIRSIMLSIIFGFSASLHAVHDQFNKAGAPEQSAGELTDAWELVPDDVSTVIGEASSYLKSLQQKFPFRKLKRFNLKKKAQLIPIISRLQEWDKYLNTEREKFAVLERQANDDYVAYMKNTMKINFDPKLGMNAEDVYSYLFGPAFDDPASVSSDQVVQRMQLKKQEAIEKGNKIDMDRLRQIGFAIRDPLTKEQFDAYLKGEETLVILQRRAQQLLAQTQETSEDLIMCKAELDSCRREYKKIVDPILFKKWSLPTFGFKGVKILNTDKPKANVPMFSPAHIARLKFYQERNNRWHYHQKYQKAKFYKELD